MPQRWNVAPAASLDAARSRLHSKQCSNSYTYTPKPAVPKLAARKPTAAQQLTTVFAKLRHLLLTEWPSIRAMNLGVKSGTGVIDQLLSVQLSQLCMQLHMLVVSDAEAAEALVLLVHKLDEQHFQQLQVLLDACGHEELSDFLHMLVEQLGPHKQAGKQVGKPGVCRGHGTATSTGNSPKVGKGAEAGDAAEATWQVRNRSAAGLFDLHGLGLPEHSYGNTHLGLHSSQDTTSLRFASLLPAGHILTKTAEGLQRQQEFQAALDTSKAAKAAGAPARKAQHQQEQVVPLLQLQPNKMSLARRGDTVGQSHLEACQDVLQEHSISGSGLLLTTTHRPHSSSSSSDHLYQSCSYPPSPWFPQQLHQAGLSELEQLDSPGPAGAGCLAGSCEPGALWLPMFSAPTKSLEQIWREGRKANTDAIYDQARLQVQQSALDCLLLEPSVMLQPHLQAASSGSNPYEASSHRVSTTSRPTSAAVGSRRATRLSSIGGISFAGASLAGAGCGAAVSAPYGSSVGAAPGAGTVGVRGLHALAGSADGNTARRYLTTVSAEESVVQCSAEACCATGISSNSDGWTSSRGRASQSASAAAVATTALGQRVQCTSPSTAVEADRSNSSKLLADLSEQPASPCSTVLAAGSVSRHSSVASNAISIDSARAALQVVVQPRLGALQGVNSVLGVGGSLGMQKRPISAESDRLRPVSAASTSRLRASTRGDLL